MDMEKEALVGALLKLNPNKLRKLLLGRPNIKLLSKMNPLDKARLAVGRKALETELSVYRKLIQKGVEGQLKDKSFLAAAGGAAMGGGALGWSLAKENPETDSRLAKILKELLFDDERLKVVGKDGEEPSVPTGAESFAPPEEYPSLPPLDTSQLMGDVIDWEAI